MVKEKFKVLNMLQMLDAGYWMLDNSESYIIPL